MNGLRDLIARLRLDTTQFGSGLQRVDAQLQRVGQRLQQAGVNLSAAITAPMTGIAVAVQRAGQSLAELQNQAVLANTGAERFKILAIAAEEYGIGQEKLADILKDTNDKVGEFLSTGGGEMKDFFEKIAPKVGVTAEQFRNLNGADALQLYVSSLQRAGLNQTEMTYYMEAIADEATALAPLLRDNGAALQEVEREARRLGLAINSDLVGSARQADRQFRITREVLGVQMQQALVRLAPAFQQLIAVAVPLVERLADWASRAGAAFTSLSPATQGVSVAVAAFAAALGPAALVIGGAVSAVGSLIGIFGGLATVVMAHPVLAAIAAIAAGSALIYQNWDGISAWFQRLWDGVSAVTLRTWEGIKSAVSGSWNFVRETFFNYHPLGVIISNWSGIEQYFSGLMLDVRAVIVDGWIAIIDFMASLPARMIELGGDIVDGLWQGIKSRWDGMVQNLYDLASGLPDWVKEPLGIQSPSRVFRAIGQWITEGLGLGISDNVPAVQAALGGVADAIGAQGEGLAGRLGAFGDAARSVFVDVVTGAQTAGDAIRSMMSQWASNKASTLASFAFDGIASWLKFANGAAFSDGRVTAFAAGGVVNGPVAFPMRGGTGLMGEAGPEAIMPLTRGPGGRLGVQSHGGGGRVVTSFDRSVGDLTMTMYDFAGQVVERKKMGIIRDSVGAASRASRKSKSFFG